MCLIAIKPKGVPLTKDFYKNLARSYYLRNSDGCGFAIKRKNAKVLYFRKSIFNIDFLIKCIKECKVKAEDELVVHLRKISGGNKFYLNTHPFVMSSELDKLNQIEGYTKEDLFFHNGTFHNFNSLNVLSDTYRYVRDAACNKNYTTYLKSLINRKKSLKFFIDLNKIVIVSLEKTLLVTNEDLFLTDENGFIYSNDSFKKQPKHIVSNGFSNLDGWGFRNPKHHINAYRNDIDDVIYD